MGREVRRVPADWSHPRDYTGQYKPLYEGRRDPLDVIEEWLNEARAWERGERPDYASAKSASLTYAEWAGGPPDPIDYMPNWPQSERTHYQMYEVTTEGTPISPVMVTPEDLARWLVDNQATTFGSGSTAAYEQWLSVCRGGWSPATTITGRVCDE